MGTMLIEAGLLPGKPPEEWNRTRASTVLGIHASYLRAGAHVIGTNTFGGTPSRLASFSLGDSVDELNQAGVRLARQAVTDSLPQRDTSSPRDISDAVDAADSSESWVALSLGPTGMLLPPVGKATQTEIKGEFARQIESAGTGYDLVLLETQYDLTEALAGLEMAKELTDVPVAVTMTFNKNPRGYFTVMGNEASRTLKKLESAGADVLGANCSIASPEMVGLAPLLRESTDRPLICQPNAGKPDVKDGAPVYNQTPEEFAEDAARLFSLGINAVGGCCGTTPDFVRSVSDRTPSIGP
jgi:methionine synthase I (cobalamin-dependent)